MKAVTLTAVTDLQIAERTASPGHESLRSHLARGARAAVEATSRSTGDRRRYQTLNIWTYTVVGDRRTRELKGMLLEDPEKALGPGITLPPTNPHVVLAQGKKG